MCFQPTFCYRVAFSLSHALLPKFYIIIIHWRFFCCCGLILTSTQQKLHNVNSCPIFPEVTLPFTELFFFFPVSARQASIIKMMLTMAMLDILHKFTNSSQRVNVSFYISMVRRLEKLWSTLISQEIWDLLTIWEICLTNTHFLGILTSLFSFFHS